MFTPRFCPAIVISVLTLPIQASILLALTPPEIAGIAEKSVVRIDGANSGTGFIVKKSGNTYTILTNAHVLNSSGNYQLLAPDGRSYPLRVKQLFPSKIDLAEAEFTSDRNYQVAELGSIKTLKPGSNIYGYGWNASSTALGDRAPQLLPGSVSSIKSGQTYQGYNLIYTLNRVPGMSGSPVYNDQGKVIGVYGLGDSDATLTLGISIDTYTQKQLITSTTSSPQADSPSPQENKSSKPVTFKITETKKVKANNGYSFVPISASPIQQGDTILYEISARNSSNLPVNKLQLNQAIRRGTTYLDNSIQCDFSCRLLFSIDGGQTYSDKPMIGDEPAPASSYTNIRIRAIDPLPAQSRIVVTYEIFVK